MMLKQYIGLGASLLLMASCNGDEKMESPSPQPEATPFPISCSIRQVNGMQGTRALIETDAALQTACAGTTNEAIAIYGSYTPNSGGNAITVFDNTALIYDASVGTNDDVNQINWNYTLTAGKQDEAYWEKDAAYTFRACYPQGALGGTSVTLSGTYNTLTTQKDLMVASTTVNTATYDMSKPVELQMNHALAAIAFKIRSEDGSDMTLESLSLSGLYTVGTFMSGGTVPVVSDWMNRKDVAEYQWTVGGLSFNTETSVTGFSSAGLSSYAEDGYILVVPQEHRYPLLDLETTMRTYTDVALGEDMAYEPGKKYTYVITVSPNQLKVTLSIKAWNKRDSSYDITF